MRNVFLILTIFLFTLSFTKPSFSEWRLVLNGSDGNEHYIDTNYVKRENEIVYFKRLINYLKPNDGYFSETFQEVDWSSVRIHSERELDVMVDKNGKEEDRYPDDEDYKFVSVCTKRAYLFGDMYEVGDAYRSGKINPSDIHGWEIFDHLLEDRDDVIRDLREMYPDGINWDDYDEEKTEDSKPSLRLVSDGE